jgi:hypothetical protein
MPQCSTTGGSFGQYQQVDTLTTQFAFTGRIWLAPEGERNRNREFELSRKPKTPERWAVLD